MKIKFSGILPKFSSVLQYGSIFVLTLAVSTFFTPDAIADEGAIRLNWEHFVTGVFGLWIAALNILYKNHKEEYNEFKAYRKEQHEALANRVTNMEGSLPAQLTLLQNNFTSVIDRLLERIREDERTQATRDRELLDRLSALNNLINKVELDVTKDYITKNDMQNLLKPLSDSIDKLSKRIT